MWKYQNTDELYHSNMYKNIGKKSEHELYHSDVYLGKDYSDGIKHYKYIRKYQKNGKTYYVYDNTEEKLNDLKAQAALKTVNAIGKDGYINSNGKRKTYSTKNGIIYNVSERYTSKKRGIGDAAKEKASNAASDIIMKHKIQKIKDIPRKIHAKGLAAISKVMMYIDDMKAGRKKKK